MKHSTGKPTKAEAVRMARLKEMCCVACEARGTPVWGMPLVEVHHLLSGNKRRGHMFTVPLCRWHHRGDLCGWTAKDAESLFGPSLARTSKKFRAMFGTDDELLARTNKQLENHDACGS